jgi:hypothetical protein
MWPWDLAHGHAPSRTAVGTPVARRPRQIPACATTAQNLAGHALSARMCQPLFGRSPNLGGRGERRRLAVAARGFSATRRRASRERQVVLPAACLRSEASARGRAPWRRSKGHARAACSKRPVGARSARQRGDRPSGSAPGASGGAGGRVPGRAGQARRPTSKKTSATVQERPALAHRRRGTTAHILARGPLSERKPCTGQGFLQYRQRDSNPCYRRERAAS